MDGVSGNHGREDHRVVDTDHFDSRWRRTRVQGDRSVCESDKHMEMTGWKEVTDKEKQNDLT